MESPASRTPLASGTLTSPLDRALLGLQRAAVSLQPSESALDRLFLLLLLIPPTLLQRFALPFAGSKIPLSIACFYAVLCLFLALRQRVIIDTPRLLLFFLFAISAVLTAYLNRPTASSLSLAFLLLIFAPFALRLDLRRADYLAMLNVFQSLVLFAVVCGVIQFAIQFPLGREAMFPFDLVLPQSWFTQGYNLRIPITEGSPYLKSTGLFFLEPSHFSQVCALALIIEAAFFRRPIRLLAFIIGVFLSFSGTGIMLLLLVGPLVFLNRRSLPLLAMAAGVGLVVLLAGEQLFVSAFTDRLQTFSDTQSSAYARFIAPVVIFRDLFEEGGIALLFGHGAGTADFVTAYTDFESHDTSWIKLVYEYGLVGAAGFFAFFLAALFGRAPSPIIACAFLVQFFLLGGYLLAPHVQFLIVVLGVWPRLIALEAEEEPAGRSLPAAGGRDQGWSPPR